MSSQLYNKIVNQRGSLENLMAKIQIGRAHV